MLQSQSQVVSFLMCPSGLQNFRALPKLLVKTSSIDFWFAKLQKTALWFQPSPMISKWRLADQGLKHQKQKTSMDMNCAKLGWLLVVVKRRCNGQCSTQLWFVEVSRSDVKPIQWSFQHLILHPIMMHKMTHPKLASSTRGLSFVRHWTRRLHQA